MKRRIVLCLLALALLLVTGCTQEKEAEPLTVTLWHVYGGEVDSPLNGLIERFNSTVGAKQNIRVKVELVSNSGSIHKSVLAAANSDPGNRRKTTPFVYDATGQNSHAKQGKGICKA